MHLNAPDVGSTVGPWLILECLDSGSFGIVYRAQRAGHPDSPPVAVKMARNPNDPRFQREAELLQRCIHPSIPHFEDMGLWTGPNHRRYPYLAMEWVEGLTLYDWLQAAPRTSREVLQVVLQLASALASAHARGAFHRDVKGDNIRVRTDGRAVLVDWGSGWFAGAHPLTDTTAPPGTTAYRPPEQRAFQWQFRKDMEARWSSSASDDLYSLGVTLYRLVTGVYLPPCTDGGEPVEREVLGPSAMATVCLELETLILRLISDDRAARGSAEQLARECTVLVQAAGPEADRPILPTASAVKTESGRAFSGSQDDRPASGESNTEPARRPPSSSPSTREERRRREPVPTWLSWAASSALGAGAVALLVVLLLRPSTPPAATPTPWLATPEEVAQFAPDAGVGEEALTSAQDVPKVMLPALLSFGRPMPSKPYPNQRRPPCEPRVEREINGACWVVVGTERPPCGDRMFDWEDRCYLASYNEGQQPTSEQP